jgi:hypothetical protein
MLKITRLDEGRSLKLEGRLAGDWVEEFRRTSIGAMWIDLRDVDYVDRNGLETLRSVIATGIIILDASPFVRAQLGFSPGV